MTNDQTSETTTTQPVSKLIIVRWLVREYMGTAITGVILFLAAGRMDWIMGWILVGITAAWVTANAIILIPRSPELLAERLGPRKGGKSWDMIIMMIVAVATIGRLVVAGLDDRFGWSTGIDVPIQVIAAVVAALAYALVTWATGVNAFFSQIVRIQEERGHSVATGGPYRFVRHPGYVGSILFELAVPIMLASWWALALGGLNALLFILRTALEDRTLQAELEGYPEYTRQTRYRLLPGIW
ncbi:MAG: isoprenylcysteine carboxylmethyltransferase family protein [Fidelibacterota bacterium]|nr:MAG: isoprenylcysteine carboxylmethyltransferase family protein [Candidatus Neomarinimicrobiota bacterium]